MYNESGGHRIQRVPPTEKNGRVHTSTVTVSVLNELKTQNSVDDSEFIIEWFSGSGKGGQHRNKHQNSCRVIHKPTGLKESRQGRVREKNLTDAKNALMKRIVKHRSDQEKSKQDHVKRNQVGSGMRGDKTFTIRFQDDTVIRHETGKRMLASSYMEGNMDNLW